MVLVQLGAKIEKNRNVDIMKCNIDEFKSYKCACKHTPRQDHLVASPKTTMILYFPDDIKL